MSKKWQLAKTAPKGEILLLCRVDMYSSNDIWLGYRDLRDGKWRECGALVDSRIPDYWTRTPSTAHLYYPTKKRADEDRRRQKQYEKMAFQGSVPTFQLPPKLRGECEKIQKAWAKLKKKKLIK